jgi:predicted transposase/invertase (TIGR01784 family)
VVVIELSAWAAAREASGGRTIDEGLDPWLYLLWEGDGIDSESPPEALRIGAIEEAMEIMSTFTKSEAAKDLYRRRMDFLSTQRSIEYDIRETARSEGLAEGRAEGRVAGASEQARTDARRLKRLGVAVEIIAEATGLSREEVEGL